MKYDTISFITDYGLKDEFVGVVKSVIRNIAPTAHVLDITHEIEPFDVRGASLTLVRSAQYLVPGVVLGVVDPEVGTDQRSIAVELGDGESVLVGPDNGLFAPVVALVGGAKRVVELTNPEFQMQAPSRTFAGRDIYAPAAAHLCNGVDLSEFGEELDVATLRPGLIPFSDEKDGVLEADVLNVDRYGNVQTNVTPEQMSSFGDVVMVAVGSKRFRARSVNAFAELADNETGVMVDGAGLVSIVLNKASASERHGLHVEATMSITRPE